MRRNKDKNENLKKIASVVVLSVIFVVLVGSVYRVYSKEKMTREALEKAQNELAETGERKEFLTASIGRLQTEEGMEFELRKKFNVSEAGERVAIIVEEQATGTVNSFEKTFWQKMKDFFGELF
jgi:cell division protein FtsB